MKIFILVLCLFQPVISLATFEAEIFKKIQAENPTQENIIFSPMSIRVAFQLASIGASGKTKEEISEILELTETRKKQYQFWTSHNNIDRLGIQFNVPNSVWINQNFRFQKNYVKMAEQNLHAETGIFNVNKADESAQKINSWINDKTQEMIPQLVDAQVFKPNLRALLINAIYFKADWEDPFKKDFTFKQPFQSTQEQNVETMVKEGFYNFWEGKDFDVLAIPYKNRKFQMLIALPRKFQSLKQLTSLFYSKSLDLILKTKPTMEKVNLKLPRFNIRSRLQNWKSALKSIGLQLPFSDQASFDKMIETVEPIKISDLIHESVVKVDEKGTKAAAATALLMVAGSAPTPPKINFHVNRPFIFMIQETQSQENIFVGAISKIEN
jgi:serpin B